MPKIAILLALYNGAEFLREQLESFQAQEERDWILIVGDDGSTDTSVDILRDFAARVGQGRVTLVDGPARGSAENFLALLALVPADVPYACFSDQDDVWLPHKLSRALAALSERPNDRPVVYTSRTMICDEALVGAKVSRHNRRPPSFRNALVQNIVSGNTIVLNPAALALVKLAETEARAEAASVVLHDWWIYQVVTGAGGEVIVDLEPGLLYRQHRGNLVGANDGLRALMVRFKMMLKGRYGEWNARNVAVLARSAQHFTPENQTLLAAFAACRQAPLLGRLATLRRLGLYRQTTLSQIGLWGAALIGRL